MTNNYFKAFRRDVVNIDEHSRPESWRTIHKIEPFNDRDRDDIVRAWDLIRRHQSDGYSLAVWRPVRDSGRWDSVPTVGQPVRAAVLP